MIEIDVETSPNGYKIIYTGMNHLTKRKVRHKFHVCFRYKSIEEQPSKQQMINIARGALDNLDERKIMTKMSPQEVKQYLTAYIKMLYRTDHGKGILANLDKSEPLEVGEHQSIREMAVPFGKSSIFTPEESAKTYCLLGSSFSGKTTLLVNELNKLDKKD